MDSTTPSDFGLWSLPEWSEGHQMLVQFLFYSDNGYLKSWESKGCPKKISGYNFQSRGQKSKVQIWTLGPRTPKGGLQNQKTSQTKNVPWQKMSQIVFQYHFLWSKYFFKFFDTNYFGTPFRKINFFQPKILYFSILLGLLPHLTLKKPFRSILKGVVESTTPRQK